jgi:putative ATPase
MGGGVACPICNEPIKEHFINEHLDSGCKSHLYEQTETLVPPKTHSFFTPVARKTAPYGKNGNPTSSPIAPPATAPRVEIDRERERERERPKTPPGTKRSFDEVTNGQADGEPQSPSAAKRKKLKAVVDAQPLAERMRPLKLEHVFGQELIGPKGTLRGMMEEKKIPSMVR